MQRWQCPINNDTLLTLILSKMWKILSFFWLKVFFLGVLLLKPVHIHLRFLCQSELRIFFESEKRRYLPHFDQIKVSTVNRALPSLPGGSLAISRPAPFNWIYYLSNHKHSYRGFLSQKTGILKQPESPQQPWTTIG